MARSDTQRSCPRSGTCDTLRVPSPTKRVEYARSATARRSVRILVPPHLVDCAHHLEPAVTVKIRCANGDVFAPDAPTIEQWRDEFGSDFVDQQLRTVARWAHTAPNPWMLKAARAAITAWMRRHAGQQALANSGAPQWLTFGFASEREWFEVIQHGPGPGNSREQWATFRATYSGNFNSDHWRDVCTELRERLEHYYRAILGPNFRRKLPPPGGSHD